MSKIDPVPLQAALRHQYLVSLALGANIALVGQAFIVVDRDARNLEFCYFISPKN